MNTSGLQFSSFPKRLQGLIVILSAAAIIILCWSISTLLHSAQDLRWLMLALLAMITAPFVVFLPSTGTMFLLGDTYLMAIAVMYGSATCVIATAVYALVATIVLFRSLGAFASVFNFSLIVCDAFLYSFAYHLAKPRGLALAALTMAVVSFLFSSVITTTAVSLQRDSIDLKRWVKSFLPLSINTLLAAACAVFVAATYRTNAWSVLAAAPIIWIMWAWTKAYESRLMRKAPVRKDAEWL